MTTEQQITDYLKLHYGGSDTNVSKWDSKPSKSTINSPHMEILGVEVCVTFASPSTRGAKAAIYWNYLPQND
jgi:hypothetical protein